MNWRRTSALSGQSGIWTIVEMRVREESRFLLYRRDETVTNGDRRSFGSKDEAKEMAERLSAIEERKAA